MAGTLQETPGASRLHIGVFGRTNSGKSSFLNAFAGQEVSIVADVAGTTTDPVTKAMEIAPLGPCVLIDTAGFGDESELGARRMERTRLAAEKTEAAVLLFPGDVFAGRMKELSGQEAWKRADARSEKEGLPGEGACAERPEEFSGQSVPQGPVCGDAEETCWAEELRWYRQFKKQGIPVLPVISKADSLVISEAGESWCADRQTADPRAAVPGNGKNGCLAAADCRPPEGPGASESKVGRLSGEPGTTKPDETGLLSAALEEIRRLTGEQPLSVSAVTREGIPQVREALARLLPEDYDSRSITGELCEADDIVLLVMPQDIQAPKGRLILPQVQTIRELLDKKCIVMSVTTDRLAGALFALARPPKLIITDSQVFGEVYRLKPAESMLTSFSVLFAAYKGDLPYYIEGAAAIDSLTPDARVLIAECCTHAPLTEDIGRVKIPRMLKKRFGEGITVDIVSGTDFPEDPGGYDLIIQCGACMFNRRYVLARIDRAKSWRVPMTNYGVAIAHLTGILDKISYIA